MPVHPVEKGGKVVGYRWGESGKLYRSKAAAERQARTIYARGWRGDGVSGRAARGILARALAANKAAELAFERHVIATFRGIHQGIMGMVDAEFLPASVQRSDARTTVKKANDLLNARLNKRVAKHLRDRVGPAYDLMAKRVGDKNAQALTMIGIPVHDLGAGVAAKVAVAREENLRLIEDAGRSYADDVRDVLTAPENEGLRVGELRDLLLERGSVNLARASLIAVDQTLKLAAAVSQARQTAAGVNSYRWSTSKDERVRPSHAALEGQIFDWDDPPVTDDRTGDTNHPGQDYRCRCIAIPMIQGLSEEAEASEPADQAAE